ncbi:MAG: hypothetical protein LBO77_00230, partial [Desulfovibrio sp.]|nr:hypothetical protein [Desulfovibrio sp.]
MAIVLQDLQSLSNTFRQLAVSCAPFLKQLGIIEERINAVLSSCNKALSEQEKNFDKLLGKMGELDEKLKGTQTCSDGWGDTLLNGLGSVGTSIIASSIFEIRHKLLSSFKNIFSTLIALAEQTGGSIAKSLGSAFSGVGGKLKGKTGQFGRFFTGLGKRAKNSADGPDREGQPPQGGKGAKRKGGGKGG